MTRIDFGTLTKQKTHYARVSIENENLKIGASHETIVFHTKVEMIGSKLKSRKNAAIPEDGSISSTDGETEIYSH
jgi:hypothetical protein